MLNAVSRMICLYVCLHSWYDTFCITQAVLYISQFHIFLFCLCLGQNKHGSQEDGSTQGDVVEYSTLYKQLYHVLQGALPRRGQNPTPWWCLSYHKNVCYNFEHCCICEYKFCLWDVLRFKLPLLFFSYINFGCF